MPSAVCVQSASGDVGVESYVPSAGPPLTVRWTSARFEPTAGAGGAGDGETTGAACVLAQPATTRTRTTTRTNMGALNRGMALSLLDRMVWLDEFGGGGGGPQRGQVTV